MNIEKMREEFEAAFIKEMTGRRGSIEDATSMLRLLPGCQRAYQNRYAQFAWWAWQQSRASLVIELPPLANTGVDAGGWPLDSGSHRVNKVINQCREAIQSTGVKVK